MISNLLKTRRHSLGISQVALSGLSGVSLPTIQNIEMNKANPSYATLEALCLALKLKISIDSLSVNLEMLVDAGLPIQMDKKTFSQPSPDTLREELIKLCLSLQVPLAENERLKEATQGLLSTIFSHYPTWYQSNLSQVPAVRDLLPKILNGRIIKLARQARERVSKIL